MRKRVRIPISVKLVAGTVAVIIAVVLPIAYRNSQVFEQKFRENQQQANADLVNAKALEVEGLILNNLEKIRTTTNVLLQDFPDELQRKRALDLVFGKDLDLVNIDIFVLEDGQPKLFKRETNLSYLNQYKLTADHINDVRKEKPFPIFSVFSNAQKIVVRNATVYGKAPMFSIAVPFADSSGVVHHVAIADIRLDRLQSSFAVSGARKLYLVDSEGFVLAHKDDEPVLEGRNFSDVPIVKEALQKSEVASKVQIPRFLDPETGKWFTGAYSRTAFGLIAVAQAPEDVILEPAKEMRAESYSIAGYAFSGALFLVILFALSLTYPIEKLNEAASYLAQGNFNIQAKVRSSDEVGQLAEAFNEMIVGLRERDRVKNILNKFHGSSVANDLMKGDLNLGGTRKEVTVLFSDIRDFTKFSEGHTPEEVVEMLNEYFEIMVGIITRNHGIVDKFVGDAIMAIWGAPNSTGQDNQFAVQACLEMRTALNELNERRGGRGQTPIKIGIGLHSGPAISGTIGSNERMEYTAIGDTVNMASRVESSTKAFGADLLVTDAVASNLSEKYIFEFAGAAEVKGKSEPIQMFKVRGYFENGSQVLISTPYSDYEAADADKVKIAETPSDDSSAA